MDLVSSSEHLCYVRCTYCSTLLAVGVPCKRLMDTVTVKCGHCNNLSFINPRPSVQTMSSEHQFQIQGNCSESRKRQASPPPLSISSEQMIPKAPFVVKPPEKKHRLPSAYNRFMKEEIQRIKAAKPDIPHREAFSMAAKNWAKCDPRSAHVSNADANGAVRDIGLQHERTGGFLAQSFDAFKQAEGKN